MECHNPRCSNPKLPSLHAHGKTARKKANGSWVRHLVNKAAAASYNRELHQAATGSKVVARPAHMGA